MRGERRDGGDCGVGVVGRELEGDWAAEREEKDRANRLGRDVVSDDFVSTGTVDRDVIDNG